MALTTATLTGPATSTANAPSTNFTVTLDDVAGVGGVVCSVSSSVFGDTITTSPVTVAEGATTGTFTVTALNLGARNITLDATVPALTIAGSPVVLTPSAGSASGGGLSGLTAEQLAVLAMRAKRRIKDGPTVPGYRARRR